MPLIQPPFARSFSLLGLVLALALFGAAGLLTGCGKSDAAKKPKKEKKQKEEETEETAEEEEEPEKSESEKAEKDEKTEKTEKDEQGEKDEKDEKDEKKKDEKTESGGEGEKVWTDLMKGNKRFVEGKHSEVQLASMRKTLIDGQKPKAIVLGCADSRVPPELLFDKNLGDLFVVRVAGNVADPVTLGSVEYAIEHLGSKLIVLLGHESCGAVAAAVSGEEMPTKNLTAIVDRIRPAFEDAKSCPIGGKLNLDCVKLNVEHSETDILKQSAVIKKAVKKGVTIVKAVYKLDTGEVERLD